MSGADSFAGGFGSAAALVAVYGAEPNAGRTEKKVRAKASEPTPSASSNWNGGQP